MIATAIGTPIADAITENTTLLPFTNSVMETDAQPASEAPFAVPGRVNQNGISGWFLLVLQRAAAATSICSSQLRLSYFK